MGLQLFRGAMKSLVGPSLKEGAAAAVGQAPLAPQESSGLCSPFSDLTRRCPVVVARMVGKSGKEA